MAQGDARGARALFERACAADPGQPALLFNLAAACKASGDAEAGLAALDGALAADPYFVQALFQKAVLFEDLGDNLSAARIYRDFLDTVPPEVADAPRFTTAIAHAREVVAEDQGALAKGIADLGMPPSRRIGASVANLTGQQPIYRSEPTFLTVPELPNLPFFDRDATPWLGQLEAGWEVVRDEARAVFGSPSGDFVPYVANPPGTPLNQWRELNHNADWGAYFLWKHGARHSEHCARLRRTAALLDGLPLLDIAGRGPNAFLSRLAPRTRIPAHHGVTNARVTVHLPLIVPPGCGFRVGPETREWVPGRAWVFDDTIEHEAWNDSDEPRLILIFDVWNPCLDAAEQQHLRMVLGAWDRHYRRTDANAEF
jgi:aspartyl/asparaginyl beta-hydroxylase (cupin superfamily)